jgi:hypothetical protein
LFTTSRASGMIVVSPDSISKSGLNVEGFCIDDINRNGFNFTDGCGFLSEDLCNLL